MDACCLLTALYPCSGLVSLGINWYLPTSPVTLPTSYPALFSGFWTMDAISFLLQRECFPAMEPPLTQPLPSRSVFS